ncbi:MAG: FtsX-like permease family protein [Bryobacterales bacterium]|nr:FtsX-like permease family protein [Bryobacterales bacterium]
MIGIRKSVGATRGEILRQFLLEAVLISVGGGFLGILLGVAMPLSVRFFADGLCGLPASRAAQLNPVEALRYEQEFLMRLALSLLLAAPLRCAEVHTLSLH